MHSSALSARASAQSESGVRLGCRQLTGTHARFQVVARLDWPRSWRAVRSSTLKSGSCSARSSSEGSSGGACGSSDAKRASQRCGGGGPCGGAAPPAGARGAAYAAS
eukprot:456081-Prymnesium_polylepis.1